LNYIPKIFNFIAPIQTYDACLPLVILVISFIQEGKCLAIGNGCEPMGDEGCASRVESIGVQVEWGSLKRRLEDVGSVSEEDVGEEVCELLGRELAGGY
jgi:hypothetical protein